MTGLSKTSSGVSFSVPCMDIFNIMGDYSVPAFPLPDSQGSRFWESTSTLTKRRDTYPFIDPFRFKDSLKGKVVLITLAHRGIGSSSAKAFAAAGASVALVGPDHRSLEAVRREITVKYQTPNLGLAADLVDADAPSRIVQLVEKNLGAIDILLNITPPSHLRPFAQEKDVTRDWWHNLEVTLRTPIAMIHAVLPSMIARGSGAIISTTSLTAIINIPFLSAQSVSQAAILKFHHQLDLEVRPKGISSFAVNPGLIPSYLHDPDDQTVLSPEDFTSEPRIRTEVMHALPEVQWDAAGLATGTFVALCADERARVLSGKYVDAAVDLGEVLAMAEHDPERIERDQLYILKLDQI